MTIVIEGGNVTVPEGVLRAGTRSAPFPQTAIIQLLGNRGSPILRLSNDRDPGTAQCAFQQG